MSRTERERERERDGKKRMEKNRFFFSLIYFVLLKIKTKIQRKIGNKVRERESLISKFQNSVPEVIKKQRIYINNMCVSV